ncbi:MAG: 4-hydroxy-tetrahydrodipicolinate reductase [Pseudomonadota bacterium]
MKLGVVGAGGSMGRALVRATANAPDATLSAASERTGSEWIGADAGSLAGISAQGVAISDDPSAFAGCDAVLDFTVPAVSAAIAERLAETSTAHIIGTTGLDEAHEARIAKAAERTAIVKSGNMSLGVNLLAALVRQAAKALPGADIEVLEMHHRRKVDAPSGTALLLADAAAQGRDVALAEQAVFAREGQTGPRAAGTIGFATLRGGTVIGEHDIILALDGERIRLGHIAENRELFANGAVTAARWSQSKPPGLYSMADVLGV